VRHQHPPAAPPAQPTPKPEQARLAKENLRLQERVRVLEQRCGHLMVDADRREERARAIAESCLEHGSEIKYLRHLASWYWAAMNQQESARRAIIGAAGSTLLALRDHTGPVPAEVLSTWLDKLIHAQDRVLRRPAGYPTLADCLRGGGCDHDGLTPELAAEIASALGIQPATAPPPGPAKAAHRGRRPQASPARQTSPATAGAASGSRASGR
jgi:hypothetical protein